MPEFTQGNQAFSPPPPGPQGLSWEHPWTSSCSGNGSCPRCAGLGEPDPGQRGQGAGRRWAVWPPTSRGSSLCPVESRHTEKGRLCWDSSLLEASRLKCPLQPGVGRGGLLPRLVQKLALQVHDQVALWGKRAPDMLLISVNLNFPQLIPRAVPRPRVGGKMDKGRPLCSPWGPREAWTGRSWVGVGAPWWMNLGVAGVRGG